MTSTRPRLLVASACASFAILVAGCTATAPSDDRVVTVRLWDEQVAEAYADSFAEFERVTPDIDVEVEVVPWASYWTRLRTDLVAGTLDDIFWTNTSTIDGLVAADAILDMNEIFTPEDFAGWSPAVVDQYSLDGGLWGVPQLTDLGLGVFYNADALDESGVDPRALDDLAWRPGEPTDSLRETATLLTVDTAGRHPDERDFDAARVARYGYSASHDLNAILLSFLGSNNAQWQDASGDFAFASPAGEEAIGYVVDLITDARVAPPASDTNPPAGASAALDLFLRGDLALLQTGPYHLATIAEQATFEWGIAPLPAGPAGRVSPTNGIVAAATAGTAGPAAQEAVLRWLGSDEHQRFVGASGAALPAALGAQDSYFEFWLASGVDISPMVEVLDDVIPAPGGAGYAAAEEAYRPLLNAVFLGEISVQEGLRRAQDAANAAAG